MRRSHRRSTAPYGIDELAGAVVVFDEVVVSFVVVVSPEAGCVVDEVVSFVVVELIVSLFAPVFGSVMPEFTGGLFAPDAAAGPP
jgi:hypothetical protein